MALQLGTIGILWSSLAALLLLSVGGLLCFRDAILSFLAARVLARRGIRCGPISLHLPLALPPSPIVLGATRCELAEGPIVALAFKEPLSIQLDGFKVGSITCASVEVDLRPRPRREVELNTLGDLTRLVGLEQAALDLMFDTAALSSQKAPPFQAGQAVVRREGQPVIRFHELEVTSSDQGMTVSSPRACFDPAAVLGEGPLVLKATSTLAVVTFAFSKSLRVEIVLDHIDAGRPTAEFRLALEPSRPAP
jgi:hypothetical protein